MPRSTLPMTLLFAVAAAGLSVAPRAASAAAPAIACAKARGDVDRNICGSPELLAMDREIAALYDRGLAEVAGGDRHQLVVSQQSFLRQRAGCAWAAHHSAHPGVAVDECVRAAMEGRVRALRTVADRGRL